MQRAVPRLPTIIIGQFIKGVNTYGLYQSGTDIVTLNRNILKDYGQTLATLIHEVAHRAGGDGSREHQDEMTRIWIVVATAKKIRAKKKMAEENSIPSAI